MELANVLLMPALFLFLAYTIEFGLGRVSYFSFIPMMGLLWIGGLYWRGKYYQLSGNKAPLNNAMSWADRAQGMLIFLTLISIGWVVFEWIHPTFSKGTGDRVVASLATSLAVLEYVNYYHRQLQHFDHKPDLQRLMAGKGFRRSQMSVDLKNWRDAR